MPAAARGIGHGVAPRGRRCTEVGEDDGGTAHARGANAAHRSRRRHGSPERFEDYRKLSAGSAEGRARHGVRAQVQDEADEDAEEVEAPVHHASKAHQAARHGRAREARDGEADDGDEEDPAEVARREAKEYMARKSHARSREEEIALQRFVDRALKTYDHSKL